MTVQSWLRLAALRADDGVNVNKQGSALGHMYFDHKRDEMRLCFQPIRVLDK